MIFTSFIILFDCKIVLLPLYSSFGVIYNDLFQLISNPKFNTMLSVVKAGNGSLFK